MTHTRRQFALGLASAITLVASGRPLFAQHASVSGKWTVTVPEMTFAMVLVQKGTEITGTLDSPHGAIALKGEFVDGRLTFAGSVDSAHPVDLSATGALRSDGTLAGDLSAAGHDMKWTAVRDERK